MRSLSIAVAVACMILSGCLRFEDTIREHKAVTSPDGSLVARALFLDAGAVSSHDQLVLLTDPGFVYEKDMEIRPYKIASMTRVADSNLDLVWTGPKALTIRFTQHGEGGWVDYRSSHRGVEITVEHLRPDKK